MGIINNKVYDNLKLLSVNGDFLAYTSEKRINWYVDRNLAIKLNDTTYQLNFITNGDKRDDRCTYHKIPLKNECVVCGNVENLTKHHVTPSQYRKLLPVEYKSRASYDVLCICNRCHHDYELCATGLKNELLNKYHLDGYEKTQLKIKHYYNKLKYYKKNIDKNSKKIMIEFLTSNLNNSFNNIINSELPTSKPVSELLMNRIENFDSFIIMWRKHFIHHAKPKFLPKEWIDNINIVLKCE